MGSDGATRGCLVCGSELLYREAEGEYRCSFCGGAFRAHEACAEGHYVCDRCHASDAFTAIRSYCMSEAGTDPMRSAVRLMSHPSVHMHGPEHHFLVPAVLLAAYCRASGREAELPALLAESEKRSSTVPGGYCGFYGTCGAGVGTGIFVSLATGATPLSGKEWGLANRMTALSLLKISETGGPRCCKRDTFAAIEEAAAFSTKELGVALQVPAKTFCGFHSRNAQCLRERCAYYPG